jgi:hypothetical protein
VKTEGPLLPPRVDVERVTSENASSAAAPALATRDHTIIQCWAREHQAQPATGEATSSGPSSPRHVVDAGSGLRFNFPGVAAFRSIAWEEWLAHFDRHELLFVYDNDSAQDGAMSNRYRVVKASEWDDVIA